MIPPGSGVGPPAGVAPPVAPVPSPSPSPIAGVPEGESATIGATAGEVPPASRPAPPAAPGGGVAAAVLSPAEIRIPVGGTGTVGLVVMGAQDLRGVDMTLTYDPAVLEAQDVAPGPLLTLDGAPVGVNRGLESGRVGPVHPGLGIGGLGVVATVMFGRAGGVVTATVEALLTTGTDASPSRRDRIRVALKQDSPSHWSGLFGCWPAARVSFTAPPGSTQLDRHPPFVASDGGALTSPRS